MIKINRAFKIFSLVISALSLILILVFFLIQKTSKELDPSRIALIDVVGNNYIFRGNNPFVTKDNQKVFAYDELTSYFNNILYQQGRKSISDYYLIDISLLDLDEYSEIKKEDRFFVDHPEHSGIMMNISTLSPSLLLERLPNSNIVTKYITDSYGLWITNTVKQIHDMASNQTDKPVIIYIHCDGGRDRTGLIAASYRMLFYDMNLAEVRLQNVADVGRNSRTLYDNAMHSYCLHMKQAYKKSDDYCV